MRRLPESFLWLLYAALAAAQTRISLPLNSVQSFSSPISPIFVLPVASLLSVSVTLCDPGTSPPRLFITNVSSAATPSSNGGTDVYEIPVSQGFGNWTGSFPNGGALAMEDLNQSSFEVGVSNTDVPFHQVLSSPPLLGDTTANQALVFSAPFDPPLPPNPLWPNYTLPQAALPQPAPPSSPANYTLILQPTTSDAATVQPACALRNTASSGVIANQTFWLRDDAGWRSQWLVEGLNPSTNYTAFVIVDENKVSGPIHFATKSAPFACPLVASLPFCPGAAYSMPLPPPPAPATFYDESNFPTSISDNILSGLTNFTTTLGTFACGRDEYSPLVGCIDCQREYRKWLCAVALTRCGEPAPSSPDAFTSPISSASATGIAASTPTDEPQKVFSALVPLKSDSPRRNPNFPEMTTDYRVLLPCLEVCTAAERACPFFLGFKCPLRRFNAHASYGVGYVDSGEEGVEGQGLVGSAQDSHGNIWCNPG